MSRFDSKFNSSPTRETWQKVLSPKVDEFIASNDGHLRITDLSIVDLFARQKAGFDQLTQDEKSEYLLWQIQMIYLRGNF